jgi:EmrB/QacA subfamily drug resistance transporter
MCKTTSGVILLYLYRLWYKKPYILTVKNDLAAGHFACRSGSTAPEQPADELFSPFIIERETPILKIEYRRYLAFLTVAMGFFMALLDSTIVTVSLPKISDYFATNIETITWVINGYNLAFAVLLITASRLADQFGRKKLFVIGLVFFTLTSFLCAISTSVHILIFFRVLQGLSAAFVVPVSMPLLLQLFPKERSGAVVGAWGAISAIAAASGPALGGIITDLLKWQWIFLINIPIGVATIFFTIALIKESFDSTATHHIDWRGIITLSVGSFALTLALIQANDKGWSSAYILTLFADGFVALTLFVIIELREKEPMMPMALFRSLSFTCSMASLFIIGVALMCGVFFLSFFLTLVLGMSQLRAGLVITALPLAAMCFAFSGPLSDRWGSRWFSVTGSAVLCMGIYLFSQLTASSTMQDIIVRLCIAGAGLGIALPAMVGSSIKNVDAEKIGIASGVGNMGRITGMVFGVAILVTILTHYADITIEQAKAQTEKTITEDAILRPETKSEFLKAVRAARFSQHSRPPTEQEIIARFEQHQADATKAATSDISRSVVKSVYKKQIGEVRKVYPRVHALFIDSLSSAFSRTFRIMSILLSISIVVAFFTESFKQRSSPLPHESARQAMHM